MSTKINAVKEIVKANIGDVYKDAAQPSVRVVGKSLAQCTSLFVTPIGRMAEIFEKNIQRYINKLDKFEEKELVSPDTRVLVPVLEKMRFIDEEKVADYYAEILATASTREHSKKVIITFIEILNRLSADEILILEYINSTDNKIPMPEFTEEEITKYGLQEKIKNGERSLYLTGGLPVIDVRIITEGRAGFLTHIDNFNCLDEKVTLNAAENISSYIDNLISLGLLERKFGFSFLIDMIYNHLEKHKKLELARTKLTNNEKFSFERGRIELTDLAHRLLELSSPKKNTK